MAVLAQTIVFLILMLVGIYARKKGIFTKEVESKISALVVNIAYPALILSSVTGTGPHISTDDLLQAVFAVVILLAITVAVAFVVPYVLGFKKEQRGIVNLMVVFTNIGFMGVPMIQNLYGSDALIYMTVFLIPFNLLFYSYAMKMIRGKDSEPFRARDLLNAGMVACVLAIVIYLANIQLPYIITTSITMLGNVTAPLAMMLLGSFLLDIDWKKTFLNGRILAFTAVKMVVVPVAVTYLISLFVSNTYILAVCMAALATPSGNVLPLLAQLYNKEAYPTALAGIAMTTAVSVVTMPLAFWMVGLA